MKIDWERVAPLAGQLSDYTTTRYWTTRGLAEGNPIVAPVVGRPSVFLALKLGAGLGMGLAVKALQDKGHRKAARVVSIVGTVLGAGPAIHNIIQGARR